MCYDGNHITELIHITVKKLLSVVTLLLASTFLYAQGGALVTDIVATPNFLVAILVGVVLAVGFQFLLTSLSVAVGVSLTPNLKEAYVESRTENNTDGDKEWHETNDSGNLGVQVTTALGIWNVLTAGLSLFAATSLALSLNPILTVPIAITLSLAIWAVFYLLMFYLEGKMAGTLIGSLINTAVSGLRAGGEALKSLVTPSPSSQVQNVADNTIEKLRQEMTATFDTDAITDAIDRFTGKVNKTVDNKLDAVPSYDKIKADLKEVVKAGGGKSNPAKWTALQSALQTAIDDSGDDNSEEGKNKTKQLKELLAEFQDSDGNLKDKAKQALSGNGKDGGNGVVQSYVNKVTEYLQSAAPEGFNTESLATQLQNFANDPQGTSADIMEQVKSMDKKTVINAIAQNTSLEKDQVESYADRVTEVLGSVSQNLLSTSNDAKNKTNGLLKDIEGSIKSFIDGTDDPRLNYADLKGDFQRILNNPDDSLDVVSNRLKSYDRDTLVSVLTNNKNLSRADIDNVVAQVEDAKTTVSDQLQAVKDKARSARNQTMRRAAIQAEHARTTAISAAWWLFTAIVVSGVAAVAGGVLEVI